ncbi:hypothetical protein ACJX0J_017815, partial [Zea mays]
KTKHMLIAWMSCLEVWYFLRQKKDEDLVEPFYLWKKDLHMQNNFKEGFIFK